MTRFGALAAALVVVLMSACGGASGAPSASSDGQPTSGASGMVAGCQPIELREPGGERIDLNGAWVEPDRTDSEAMVWWFKAIGDCIWGVGTIPNSESPFMGEGSVQNLRGTLNPDFTIDAEIAHLGPRFSFNYTIDVADVRIRIEFPDDGGIILREERDPGQVGGPRCPVDSYCIPPLVLEPE
ncbi:MAG TPA: hypothetical protein VH720_03785 [Candidatus Limnocylindrales bacterium]|jgi:hypothetical protein